MLYSKSFTFLLFTTPFILFVSIIQKCGAGTEVLANTMKFNFTPTRTSQHVSIHPSKSNNLHFYSKNSFPEAKLRMNRSRGPVQAIHGDKNDQMPFLKFWG